jgi:crotonobetainyl-CoA:carnitine CoA-transferase CaiB-like acyl-CoA transferase
MTAPGTIASPPSPLEGVRVLDLSTGIGGPVCAKLLAQLGAEVIKIEPPGGDPARGLQPFAGDTVHPERSGAFLYFNTGKRGVTLDLGAADDRERLLSLVDGADVLVESFEPGALDALGLDLAALHARNPRLVLTSITFFGQTGPRRLWKGTEIVAFGMSGLMDTIGFRDDPPLKFGGNSVQYMAGLAGFTGTLAALRHVEATGHGQQIDVSVQECGASSHFQALAQYAYLGTVMKRSPTMMVFPCLDGWVGAQIQPHHWSRFVELVGIPELAEMRGSVVERSANADMIETLLLPWMLERSKTELYRLGQEAGLPFSFFANVADLEQSPQYLAREAFVEVDHPVAGNARYPGPPFIMPGVSRVERRAPLLGEHNAEVFGGGPVWAARGHETSDRERAEDTVAPRLPLTGVRVLDLGMFQSAPYCGRLLADLGAEVIKVESARRPDPPRVQGRGLFPGGDPGERPWNRSGMINERNRGKLGLAIDLTTPEGLARFRELVEVSDVIVENFSSRVMAKFGLDYPSLAKLNPRIIALSIGSQGRTGPEKSYVSYGTTLEQTGGLMSITGFPNNAPGFSSVAYPDSLAGVFATGLVIAALRQRDRTGRGLPIDLSQRELTTVAIGEAVMTYTLTGRVPGPDGNRDANWAPQGAYACRDEGAPSGERSSGQDGDHWVTIACTTDEEWRALCGVIDRDELAADVRFASPSGRREHHDEIDAVITGWTSQRGHQEAARLLQAAGVPAGPVLAIDELFADPHLGARGYWEEVDDTDAGRHRYPSRPWKMTGTPLTSRRPAPLLGEHTDQILGKLLGLAGEDLEDLRERGVTADVPLGLVAAD